MRDLNEIVVRNARRLIEEAQKRDAEKPGSKELNFHQLAALMAGHMGMQQNSVYKQLRRLLPDDPDDTPHQWTVNYIQGFALAMRKTIYDLLEPLPERKSPESRAKKRGGQIVQNRS